MKSAVALFVAVAGALALVAALLIGFSGSHSDSAVASAAVTDEGIKLNLYEELKLQTGEINSLRQELTEAERGRERAASELRGRDTLIAELEGRNEQLGQQLAEAWTAAESRVPAIGVRCPITGLAVERQAQVRAILEGFDQELAERSRRYFEAETAMLTEADIASGKHPKPYRQSAEEWRENRNRAYAALAALWGRETLDKLIVDARALWEREVGDGENAAKVATFAMQRPFIAQVIRLLGARD